MAQPGRLVPVRCLRETAPEVNPWA
jgi:hypothetical protein